MKQIAILGGTFNPIHMAHLKMAEFVYSTGKYDEILFIPTGIPPHKSDESHIASKKHRMNMCLLATQPYPYYHVSDIELKRKGESFTVDTLEVLQKEHPDNHYTLIIGADSLINLSKWHNPKKLLQIGHFLVAKRPGYDNFIQEHVHFLKEKYHADITLLEMPEIPISSSQIRQLISEHKPIDEFVPADVAHYIKGHNLYQGISYHALDLHKLEIKLKKNLSEKRFVHSVSVMDTAVQLALHHDCDMEKAAIAGLLHDCAKSLSNKQKLELAVKYDIQLSHAETDNPDLLHAKLGTIIAKEEYNVYDQEILDAIECHTTGKPNMTNLEKVIFIADYIEPKRTGMPRADEIRTLAIKSLDAALLEIINDTLMYLKVQNRTIDTRTIDTHAYYQS